MAKAPADQFYFSDYIRDTRSLSLEARGAWMDILSQGFFKTPQGRISQDLDAWATMFGCSVDTAKTVLEAIKKHQVGDVVTERNGNITVTNRRQYRTWKEKDDARIRQENYRKRRGHDEEEPKSRKNNGKVTSYSSSSSSTSSSSSKTNTHTREGPSENLQASDYEFPVKQLVEAFPTMRLTPKAIGFIENEVKPGDELAWTKTISIYRMNFDPERNSYMPEKTANLLSVFSSEKEKLEKHRQKNGNKDLSSQVGKPREQSSPPPKCEACADTGEQVVKSDAVDAIGGVKIIPCTKCGNCK